MWDTYRMSSLLIWVARIWLKTVGGGGGGGARQCAQILGNRCFFVGIQSGTNFAFFGTTFWPVGIQSGTNFRVFGTTFGLVGKQLKSPKNVPCKNVFFIFLNEFGCLPTWVPDWIPTGSRLNLWIGKNPLPHLFSPAQTHPCPYFLFPRTSRAPIPPSCTKTAKAIMSQTGVLQLLIYIHYVYIYMNILYYMK